MLLASSSSCDVAMDSCDITVHIEFSHRILYSVALPYGRGGWRAEKVLEMMVGVLCRPVQLLPGTQPGQFRSQLLRLWTED